MRIARGSVLAGSWWRRYLAALLTAGLVMVVVPRAQAGSPRFVAGQGPGWNVPSWSIVAWFRTSVAYFTDEGPLSASVNHAQADAMVAAAAAVWNVPTSSVALAKGGELAEDVSTANSYFDGAEVVLPADVQVANEAAVPVAIVYDTDGSLIDLLLGPGASEPDSCQENAVVGDVDDLHRSNGEIAHATLILNGRCVGAAPEQLTQMQYQLARAFGRVLGLSWSQTNDNVFTAQSPVTANQLAFWPLMHPIDVICGDYSYQCMTNPFTLRADDLNTLAQLYPVYQASVPAGKQGTSNDALYLRGLLLFPTNQGMEWVNVTTRRAHQGVVEDWQTVSAMTGFEYQQASGTPLDSTRAVDSGLSNAGLDAYFVFRRVPLDGISDVSFTAEAINPLYIGEAAIGPYTRFPASPSGSTDLFVAYSALSNGDGPVNADAYPPNAASSCNPGADGSEGAPATFDPSGWQAGQLCAWNHNSWWSIAAAAGHTWTLEVTATDETGAASLSKAMPVMGVWQGSDATGVAPTISAQPVAFNSMAFGMTQIPMDASASDAVYRVSVSDQFGAGRPDFTYTARVLYADHVEPATVGTVGGPITVIGTGFRRGMQVLVNGVAAAVVSCSPTEMVANVPRMAQAGASVGVPVDIAVVDPETAGSASVPQAMSYVVLPDGMQVISAPAGLKIGETAAVPLAVRVLASDGLTPVAGATVVLSASTGAGALAVCDGRASCSVVSGVDGVVQTAVSGTSAGSVVITATEIPGTASVQVSLGVTAPVRTVVLARTHYVAAGQADSWAMQLTAVEDGVPAAAVPVAWTVGSRLTPSAVDGVTDVAGAGTLQVNAPGLASGAMEIVGACAWGALCAQVAIHAVDPVEWTPVALPGAAQSVSSTGSFIAFQVRITDQAGHALEKATAQVDQRVLGWEGTCTESGRCPAAPVLRSAQTVVTSDGDGLITITPLEVAGVPQTVQVAVATGSQGFLTVTLVKVP